jgi:hypothetical protein
MDGIDYEGTVTVKVKVRLTAQDWQLFTASMNCNSAAAALNIAASKALSTNNVDEAWAIFRGAERLGELRRCRHRAALGVRRSGGPLHRQQGGQVMDHSNHSLVLVAENVIVAVPVALTERGDVEMTGSPSIEDWDNSSSHVFCQTCHRTVRAGEDDLADDWQFI